MPTLGFLVNAKSPGIAQGASKAIIEKHCLNAGRSVRSANCSPSSYNAANGMQFLVNGCDPSWTQTRLCCFPHPIQNLRSQRCLVLRKEPAIMLLNRFRCVLNGIAGLLVRPGLLKNVGRQHVTHIVRTMRK